MDITYSPEELFNKILGVAKLFQTKVGDEGSALGSMQSIRGRERLLIILYRYPSGLREYELAEKAHVARSTITRFLKGLKGYIQKKWVKDDERGKIVLLTEAGAKRAEEISAAWNSYLKECFAGLSVDERIDLTKLLQKVIDHNVNKPCPPYPITDSGTTNIPEETIIHSSTESTIAETETGVDHSPQQLQPAASVFKGNTAAFLSTSPELDTRDDKYLTPKLPDPQRQFDLSYMNLNRNRDNDEVADAEDTDPEDTDVDSTVEETG